MTWVYDLSFMLRKSLVFSSLSWAKLQNLFSAISITLWEILEEANYTQPQVEGNDTLCNSNDKENEWDNRDTEENSWEDHTNNVGDNEYKSSYQPWQQQPTLSFDTAVHKHDGGEKVEDQENDTNNEEDKHGIAQTFNLWIIVFRKDSCFFFISGQRGHSAPEITVYEWVCRILSSSSISVQHMHGHFGKKISVH